MKFRVVRVVCLGIAVILMTFALASQAATAVRSDRAVPLSAWAEGSDASIQPADPWHTAEIAFTQVSTSYLPIVAKNYPPRYLTWLRLQQDEATGLLPCQQDNYASTYCNALAVIAFTLEGDYTRAKKVLAHFNSQASEFFDGSCTDFQDPCSITDPCGPTAPCGFFQSRDSTTGIPFPGCGNPRWMGDNAWLLMAIHYYQSRTGDAHYASMAQALLRKLKSFQQQPDGYIAAGWEDCDATFNTSGYAEGTLSAHKPLALYDEALIAQQVKDWLGFSEFAHLTWQRGPLDLHSWRVQSLGKEYGFCLADTERTDDGALRYRNSFSYGGSLATGFLPMPIGYFRDLDCSMEENAWSEGTGQMAVSFFKAGYWDYGTFYVGELEKLLFEPADFPGTLAISYLPDSSDCPGYESFDPNKGHVAPVTWYIFAKVHFDPFDGIAMAPSRIANPVAQIEAENYDSSTAPGIRWDRTGEVFEGNAIHIGGDDASAGGNSGWADYRFNVLVSLNDATVSMRYSDDVEGDTVRIWLDGVLVTSFDTDDTEWWDDYVITVPAPIGSVGPGLHTLRLEVVDQGTYGLTVDYFRLDNTWSLQRVPARAYISQ